MECLVSTWHQPQTNILTLIMQTSRVVSGRKMCNLQRMKLVIDYTIECTGMSLFHYFA